MVQVENEIGMLESARDYSLEATRLYNSDVPEELLSYIKSHAKTLHPYTLNKVLRAARRFQAKAKNAFTETETRRHMGLAVR